MLILTESVLNINLSVGEERKVRAGNKIGINENLAICKGMRISEYGTFFLVESEILGFNSIRNPAQRIQNSANNFKPGIQVSLTKNPEFSTGIRNLKSTAWNLEPKTVLDKLT